MTGHVVFVAPTTGGSGLLTQATPTTSVTSTPAAAPTTTTPATLTGWLPADTSREIRRVAKAKAQSSHSQKRLDQSEKQGIVSWAQCPKQRRRFARGLRLADASRLLGAAT